MWQSPYLETQERRAAAALRVCRDYVVARLKPARTPRASEQLPLLVAAAAASEGTTTTDFDIGSQKSDSDDSGDEFFMVQMQNAMAQHSGGSGSSSGTGGYPMPKIAPKREKK